MAKMGDRGAFTLKIESVCPGCSPELQGNIIWGGARSSLNAKDYPEAIQWVTGIDSHGQHRS